MKKIFIVGGNGFARECHYNLIKLSKYGKDIIFGGFLGHGGYGHTVDYKSYQHLYLGEVSEHEFKEDEYCIIGAGYPNLRIKIYNELKSRNIKFFNLITDSAVICESATIGEANVINGNSSISVDTNIGSCNVLNGDVIIGHDTQIGDFNFIGPRSQILGNVKIGSNNTIGANVVFLPKAKIGDNNHIAPLSAVYRGCRNNSYMQGNPALKVGEVEI